MTRYTHTMCMAFGADGEPDRVEVDATFDYLVTGSAVSDIRVLKIDGRAVAVADAALHDRIHDDLESGRFDDLLISLAGTGDLEPCPFCGSDVRVRKGVNGYGHCQTEGCHANRAQIVSLDDPKQVAAWNRRAAPAPSSLAGGEVMNDDAPTYMRLAQALSRHPEVMVVERSDPTLELTSDSLEHLLEDVFPLAALSPEAPAREVSEWFGVTGAADETEALAVALFDVRCPGIRMTEEDLHYYRAAAQRAMKTVADELDTPALTPRHEAPADLCKSCNGTGRELGSRFNRCLECWTEAPAEGAGEVADRFEKYLTERARSRQLDPEDIHGMHIGDVREVVLTVADLRTAIIALRARSSAPEALGNLLAVIHRDGGHRTLEVGVEQAAAEAEKIVANLLSSAPEACDGEAWAWGWYDDGGGKRAITHLPTISAFPNVEAFPLYTHPAAPSVDKLRIAVEALERIADEAPYRSGYCQSDVDYAPKLSDKEMQAVAQAALSSMEAEGC